MIPIGLESPVKIQVPELQLRSSNRGALRRGGLEVGWGREHAAAGHFRAGVLQVAGMPVAPSPAYARDGQSRHRLQHLASLLHLLYQRGGGGGSGGGGGGSVLLLRLHRINFL